MNNSFQRQVGTILAASENKHCLPTSCFCLKLKILVQFLKGFSEFIISRITHRTKEVIKHSLLNKHEYIFK